MNRKSKRTPKVPRPREVVYWHGGTPGLAPGTLLLPASELGWDQTHPELGFVGPNDYYDHSRVYIASVRNSARLVAATWHANGALGGGWVYRVKPLGPVESDPDEPGSSWMTPRARILAVDETDIYMSPLDLNAASSHTSFYADGAPLYSEDGWQLAQPSLVSRTDVRAEIKKANSQLAILENGWFRRRNIPHEEVVAPSLDQLLHAIEIAQPYQPGPALGRGAH